MEWLRIPEQLRRDADLEKGFEFYTQNPHFTIDQLCGALGVGRHVYEKFKPTLTEFLEIGLLRNGMDPEAHKGLKKLKGNSRNGINHDLLKVITTATMAKFSNKQIEYLLGISSQLWSHWKKSPAVQNAIHEGSTGATAMVINALFERAVGKKVKEQKIVSYQGSYTVVDVEKEIPADVNAQKLWLINHTDWEIEKAATTANHDHEETAWDVRSSMYEEPLDE